MHLLPFGIRFILHYVIPKKRSEKPVKEQWHNAPCIKRELLFYSGYNTVVGRSTLSFPRARVCTVVCMQTHLILREAYVRRVASHGLSQVTST
jgi:hypothetical protein